MPCFIYNSAVFHRIILQDKLHSFNIQDRFKARLSLAQKIIKMTTTLKTLLYRRDCAVRSICHYVVSRVMIGFKQKLSKKSYFQFQKSPVPKPPLNFAKRQTCNAKLPSLPVKKPAFSPPKSDRRFISTNYFMCLISAISWKLAKKITIYKKK